jgi:hypothetical protein
MLMKELDKKRVGLVPLGPDVVSPSPKAEFSALSGMLGEP